MKKQWQSMPFGDLKEVGQVVWPLGGGAPGFYEKVAVTTALMLVSRVYVWLVKREIANT